MARVTTIAHNPRLQPALYAIGIEMADLIELAIEIQQIPAPTFDEGKRALFVEQRFQALGLQDVSIDALHNVYGRFAGRDNHLAPIVVSAHSDTVFPHRTDLSVRRDGHLIHGPGIGDNSMGVAGLLTLVETLKRFNLQPDNDIWFVVNVGEEGLGNLCGMRVVVDRFATAAGFIVIEGGMYGYLLHEAIGVRRYRIEAETAGGHSWSDFGRKNAIHILAHTIAQIDQIVVPNRPKTTYNIGVIEGGTSINTIAAKANCLLDLRSESAEGLDYLITQIDRIVTRTRLKFDSNMKLIEIGNRPAGTLSRQAPLVRHAEAALRAVGCERIHYLSGSTDANIPLSRNLPAVCIGLARSKYAHRQDEYLDTTYLPQGMQQLLLLTLAAANFR